MRYIRINKTLKHMLFEAKGMNGVLQIFPDRVNIIRKGLLALSSQGRAGDKSIALDSINSIQFKDAGWLSGNGFIQFAFSGSTELRGGLKQASTDENAIVFNVGQNKAFLQAKELIEKHRSELKAR